MLSFDEIKKHYSDRELLLPQLVLKEYLQHRILEIIFSSQYGDDLVFMGETAIRLVYGNDRFSEDLDLDNQTMTEDDFAAMTVHIQKKLEQEGLLVEFRNTYKDVYHCYIKFPRILFDNKLSPLKDEKIMIRLDSFTTDMDYAVKSHVISKADIFSEIRVYGEDLLLSQKIDALFNRKRSKGRDLYDVVYLFSLTEPNYTYLNEKIGVSNKIDLIEKMKKLFSENELQLLARDVKPFLIDSHKIKQVEKFNMWLESMNK